MRQLNLVLVVLSLLPDSRLAAEEWLGLENDQPVLIGIDQGEDEVGDSSRALLLSLPLGDRMGYYGYYSETQLTDLEQEFDNLLLLTSIWVQLSELVEFEIQHLFEGHEDELEQETLGLALSLTRGAWQLRIHLEDGDTQLFTRDVDSDFFATYVPGSFTTDVSAIGLSLGWQSQTWYWQASYQSYDYEKDLSVLSRSLFASIIVKSSTLAHSSLLISQNASLLAGYAALDNDYSIQIAQNQSAIDSSYDETLILSWQHWTSQRFGYLLAAATTLPLDDSIGLTLGLRWML